MQTRDIATNRALARFFRALSTAALDLAQELEAERPSGDGSLSIEDANLGSLQRQVAEAAFHLPQRGPKFYSACFDNRCHQSSNRHRDARFRRDGFVNEIERADGLVLRWLAATMPLRIMQIG